MDPNYGDSDWGDGGGFGSSSGSSMWPGGWQGAGMGMGLGGALGSFMGGMGGPNYGYIYGGTNPYDAASQYLNQMPGNIHKYFDPYVGMGNQLRGSLQDQLGQMVNNPNQLLNKFGSDYQQSPGYQFQVNQALGSANRAAAAGGMLGSPAEQVGVSGVVNNLANQDYQQYLNNVMGIYNNGLSGQMGLENQGFQATGDLVGGLNNYLASMAQNQQAKYMAQQQQRAQQEAQRQQQQQNMFNGVGDIAGGIAGFFL